MLIAFRPRMTGAAIGGAPCGGPPHVATTVLMATTLRMTTKAPMAATVPTATAEHVATLQPSTVAARGQYTLSSVFGLLYPHVTFTIPSYPSVFS